MTRLLRILTPIFGLLISFCSLHAAVSGTVVNRTTNQPAADSLVTLYQMGEAGMTPVGTVKADADGNFTIDHNISGGMHMLQAIHDGVVYNQIVQPGSATAGIEVAVFDSTTDRQEASVSQHMILLEPMGGIIHVNESVIYTNSGNMTLNDPNGTFRFWLPPEVQGEPRLMVTAPQGMPVQRETAVTGEPNVRQVDFPVKPGETRFDLTYVLSPGDEPVFEGKILHEGGPVRLVAPQGVTLIGDSIEQIGQEPSTQAKVYDVAATEFSIRVEGSGSLSTPEGGAPAASGGGRGVEQIQARVYDNVVPIVALALLILAAGFVLLYRRSSTALAPAAEAADTGKTTKKKGRRS